MPLLVHQEVEVAPPGEELVAVDGLRPEDVGHEAERLLRLVPEARHTGGDVLAVGYVEVGDALVLSHAPTLFARMPPCPVRSRERAADRPLTEQPNSVPNPMLSYNHPSYTITT